MALPPQEVGISIYLCLSSQRTFPGSPGEGYGAAFHAFSGPSCANERPDDDHSHQIRQLTSVGAAAAVWRRNCTKNGRWWWWYLTVA